MHTLANTMLTIGLQLTLGALICSAAAACFPRIPHGADRRQRRRFAIHTRAAAKMMRSLPLGVGLGLAGAALRVALGADPRDLLLGAGLSAFLIAGVIPTSGAYLVHHATRQEAGGRLRIARRQIRFGGSLMFWGTLALLVGTGVVGFLRPGFPAALFSGSPNAAALLAASALALGGAGFVALLAGLSRKPRPSGGYAVLLYLCGLTGMLGAAGLL